MTLSVGCYMVLYLALYSCIFINMKLINIFSCLIALFCIFTLSCSVPMQRVEKSPERVAEKPLYIKIKKIALIPLTSDKDVLPGKEQYLTDILYNELISKVKINIATLESSTAQFAELKNENPDLSYKDLALKVGSELGCEVVLIGNIYTYMEREGGELGVSSPASVAFGVELLTTANGEMLWESYFSETPLQTARKWEGCGARLIHVVDLDGAFSGEPRNFEIIRDIVNTVSADVQVGGGIRNINTVEKYISVGVRRVILGTSAIQDRKFLIDVCKSFPERVGVGIDTKMGKIAVKGWKEVIDLDTEDFPS